MFTQGVLGKVIGALVILGALNWGLVGVFDINLVDRMFGMMTGVSRLVYGLIGVAGLLYLLSYLGIGKK